MLADLIWFSQTRHHLLMPTGSGKSTIILLISSIAVKLGHNVCIITSSELLAK